MGLVAIFVLSLNLGTTIYSPIETYNALFTEADENLKSILLEVRLPRALVAVLVGFAIAQAGWILQATFANPLADPALIGISPIAAIGVVLAFSFGSLQFGMFFGVIFLLFALLYLAALQVPNQKFILAAFAFGSMATALLGVLTTSPLNASGKSLTAWIFGSISTVNFEQLITLAVPVLVSTLLLSRQTQLLDLLSLGERTAQNLGVEINRTRAKVFLTASLLIAPAVAVSGVVGFVGLAIPMAARELIPGRHQHQQMLVLGLGGISVLVADTFSRMLFAPIEIPLGITLTLIGAPIMFRSLVGSGVRV
ncbi:MAG: hypothetical protein RL038_216 [Actinomycetota bacterium]